MKTWVRARMPCSWGWVNIYLFGVWKREREVKWGDLKLWWAMKRISMISLCNLVKENEGSLESVQRPQVHGDLYTCPPERAQGGITNQASHCSAWVGGRRRILHNQGWHGKMRGVLWMETKDKARIRMAQRMLVKWTDDSQGQNSHAFTKDLEWDATSEKTL